MTPLDRLRELEADAPRPPWRMHVRSNVEEARVHDGSGATLAFCDGRRHMAYGATAALIAESRNALPNLLTLEALARDEHEKRCGCTGEACKLGEVLRVLDGEPT